MNVEPSDIIKLLADLGREDPTCHRLRQYAASGENILTVCHEAIRILAAEKAVMSKQALDLLSLQGPRPFVISQEDADRAGIRMLPNAPGTSR